MRIHLVAIGGSVMHNLALELAAMGHDVTGSDDEIYEPSRTRLEAAGILPDQIGWRPDVIDKSQDCVIAGMHARRDNPEIARAIELGIRIYSFPEFYGERCRDKKRIVVAGSHGKTTTTAMIMHTLKESGREFDYLVGASLEGFDRNVKLSKAPLCVIEGDEYLSSPLDRRPKIMHYDPDVAIITGIAWDHMNVFPTWESYLEAFRMFIASMRKDTLLIWYAGDVHLKELVMKHGGHLRTVAYTEFSGEVEGYQVFGKHNLQNMAAAALACAEVGVTAQEFAKRMMGFKGASMRLQQMPASDGLIAYRDFAHAPSKVKATVEAVREKHPGSYLVAVFELHTYSSLNAHFIPLYKGSCAAADHVICFYSPHTLEIKKMPFISSSEIIDAFAHTSIEVATAPATLRERLLHFTTLPEETVILLMSSGRFGGLNINDILNPS